MAAQGKSQVLTYIAWNTSTNAYVNGDVANHTLNWMKDGLLGSTINTATGLGFAGLYKLTMDSTETQALEGTLGGVSSTGNVVIIPTMVAFTPDPLAMANLGSYAPTSAGFRLSYLDTTVSTRESGGDPRLAYLDSSITTRLAGNAPILNTLDTAVSTRAATSDPRFSFLDSAVSSRMGTFTLPPRFASLAIDVNGDVTIGGAAAGSLDASAFTTAALNAMADALLDRNMATGTDSGTNTVRTVRQALRVSRNKVDTTTGEVFKEDDTTVTFTFSVTTAAGNPITVFDPDNV